MEWQEQSAPVVTSSVLKRSVAAVGSGRFFVELSGFVASVALARLLGPRNFGLALPAFFVITVASTFRDQTVSQPIVTKSLATRVDLENGQFLGVVGTFVFGCAFSGAILLLQRIIDAGFGSGAAVLLAVAGAAFPLSGLGAVAAAQRQRRLDFGSLARADAIGAITSAGISVGLAALGVGSISLVAGGLTALFVASLVLIGTTPWVRPTAHPRVLWESLQLSAPAASNALFYAIFQNIDYLLVNALFSARIAGLYWRAFQLGVEYQGKVTVVMQQIAFPVFSRSSAAQRRVLRSMIVKVHAMVLLPVLAILAATAPGVVELLYGPRWQGVAPLLRLCALGGMGVTLASGVGPLILALGRAPALALWSSAQLAGLILVVIFASPLGIIFTTAAIAALHLLSAPLSAYFLVDRVAGIPISEFLGELKLPLIWAVTCGGFALLSYLAVESVAASPSAAAVGASVAALGAHFLVARKVIPQYFVDPASAEHDAAARRSS